MTFWLFKPSCPRVSGRRLTKILTLVAALAASGGAFASAGKVSPNLNIVQKAKKSDKKQKVGFTAFMKQSAQNWGRGVVRLVAHAGQAKRHYAAVPAQKRSSAQIKTALVNDSAADASHPHGVLFDSPALTVSPAAGACNTKEDSAAQGQKPGVPGAPAPPNRCLSGSIYTLNLPSLRYFLDWFRPVAAVSGGMSDSAGMTHRGVKPATQRDIPQARNLSPFGQASSAQAPAAAMAHFHFTIDPTQPHASLTHGAMGAGSALSSDRPRDHRA